MRNKTRHITRVPWIVQRQYAMHWGLRQPGIRTSTWRRGSAHDQNLPESPIERAGRLGSEQVLCAECGVLFYVQHYPFTCQWCGAGPLCGGCYEWHTMECSQDQDAEDEQ